MHDKIFIRNKAAQLFALVFVCDYPKRWPSFFTDLLQTLSLGPRAVDLYLRVLLAIDSEVVDREIVHSKEEADRNTLIKDHMRDTCVEALVDSWYHILVRYACLVPVVNINTRFLSVFSLHMKQHIQIWFAKHWRWLVLISHGST